MAKGEVSQTSTRTDALIFVLFLVAYNDNMIIDIPDSDGMCHTHHKEAKHNVRSQIYSYMEKRQGITHDSTHSLYIQNALLCLCMTILLYHWLTCYDSFVMYLIHSSNLLQFVRHAANTSTNRCTHKIHVLGVGPSLILHSHDRKNWF